MTFLTSGTFWTFAGVLVAVALGVYGVRSTNPKRLLYYDVTVIPPSSSAPSNVHGRLRVTLRSHARADIGIDLFDNMPLWIDAGGPLDPSTLDISPVPPTSTFRTVSIDGQVMKIGPEQIDRRQEIIFTANLAAPQIRPAEWMIKPRGVRVLPMSARRSTQQILRSASFVLTGAAAFAGVLIAALALARGNHQDPVSISTLPHNVPTSSTATSPANLTAPAADLASTDNNRQARAIQDLRQIMRQGPNEQLAALQLLTAFIRTSSPAKGASDQDITPIIQAAVQVIATRDAASDSGVVIDLNGVNLTSADLASGQFAGANLQGADFTSADLQNATFAGADLHSAYLGYANVTNANFDNADLIQASFVATPLCPGSHPVHPEQRYNCTK